MNLFRSEEHARCWPAFQARSEEGFIGLVELAGFFATESRHHMLDADYLSTWYPRRAEERRAYLERSARGARSGSGRRTPARYTIRTTMAPSLDRLDHLILHVRDMDATCAFYRRVLGMEVETFGKGRTALRFGCHKINLEPLGPMLDGSARTPIHLCFITSTPLPDWIEHITSCGVVLTEGPVRRSGAEGPIDSIYIVDPDSNSIEVSTYPSPESAP
jgi:catechol 2,3-dioxygenase-like lactoylglutathione lyase family enzyme